MRQELLSENLQVISIPGFEKPVPPVSGSVSRRMRRLRELRKEGRDGDAVAFWLKNGKGISFRALVNSGRVEHRVEEDE